MSERLFEEGLEYDAMLERGIRLSGEDKRFFIEGRLRALARSLPGSFTPRHVLDFGCGTGDTTGALARMFPTAVVLGIDPAESALRVARGCHGSARTVFRSEAEPPEDGTMCLAYVNGVFHHIEPAQRGAAVRRLHGWLRPGGMFALFENNPWNPGTRLVMRRIPFDRDAKTIAPPRARRMLLEGGFAECARARFLFFFPRVLSVLRPLERRLVRVPLGAQYFVLAEKR